MGYRDEHGFLFFFQGWLSNFYPAKFRFMGKEFNNTEQAFMWYKAIYFNDLATAEKILTCKSPMDAKILGRQVKGYVDAEWAKVRFEIMYKVNFHKYSSNEELARQLMETGCKILVEANPRDAIWAIGMDQHDPRATQPEHWLGKNLLGLVLMQVRAELTRGYKDGRFGSFATMRDFGTPD